MAEAPAGERQQAARHQRTRNPRGQGARLRTELIEAAARLLESSGDARSLTLRAVAREVGIAAPSIYRHFSGTDELVQALVADRFEQLDRALTQAISASTDPAQALRNGCRAYCQFGLQHPGHYQILFSATLALDPAARPQDRAGERAFGRLVDAVKVYNDATHAGVNDSFATAVNIWVALHGIVSLRTSRPAFPWPPVNTLIDAALQGQAGLQSEPAAPTRLDAPAGHDR